MTTYYFFESSALVKLFVAEQGTDSMIRLIETTDDNRKLVSSVAPVEVRSAIRRRVRSGEIDSSDADLALIDLGSEMLRMVEQPVSPTVLELARQVIDRHFLRALDALHLATCLVARDNLRATDVCFVASDIELLKAAKVENLPILNPEGKII